MVGRSGSIAVMAAIGALIAPAAAAAVERYASPTGTGAACTEAAPCSIQTATEDPSVANGDEVLLAPGDYMLGADPLVIFDGVVIRPANPATRPVIIGSGPLTGIYTGAVVQLFGNSAIRGIQIEARNTGGFSCAVATQAQVRIDRVIVRAIGNDPDTSRHPGCGVLMKLGSTITNSIVYTNSAGSSAVRTGNGESTIRNVTAIATDSSPFETGGLSADNGWGTPQAVTVVNSILSGDVDVRAIDQVFGVQEPVVVEISYSNFATVTEQPTQAVVVEGAGNQTAAPVFVDAGALDFHQTAASPTVDAGIDSAANGTADIDGFDRTQGAATDIGADEIGTGPAPPADETPPATTIVSGPAADSFIRDSTPTFTFSSNEPGSTFLCAADGRSGPCSGPALTHTFGPLVDGSHSFSVYATDPAGNPDLTPEFRGFTVDTVAPELTITGGPADGTTTEDTSPTFSFVANEQASFQCRWDSDPFGPCVSPYTEELSEGEHSFSVFARDLAGNPSETVTRSVTVDAPEPPLDTDGDGIPDASDECDASAGPVPSGCPTVERTATLRYKPRKGVLKGRVRAEVPGCVDAEVVKLLRKRKGRDRRIEKVETNQDGRFRAKVGDLREGAYYAKVKFSTAPGVAFCAKTRSPNEKV